MKTKTLKALGAAVAVALGMGGTLPVLATSTSIRPLETAATDTDAFAFTCPSFTDRARARVEDLPPTNTAARMTVMVTKGGGAVQATDLNPFFGAGEGFTSPPSPSPFAVLKKGHGLYLAIFLKTADGSEMYRGSVVCTTATGDPLFNPMLTKIQ